MQADAHVCSLIFFDFCWKVPLIVGVAALVTYFLIVDDKFGLVSECESWAIVIPLKIHEGFSLMFSVFLFCSAQMDFDSVHSSRSGCVNSTLLRLLSRPGPDGTRDRT